MNRTLTRIAVGALALVAIAAGSSAHAQATIDQNKALAGSVTPGDTPGFPVTLSMPGSYKLTGNLVVPAGLSGIEITASGVTLDLNGFNITGPVTCARNGVSYAVTCSSITAVTRGVEFKAGGNTVRNGQVRGFYMGVYFWGADQLENLLLEHNYDDGASAANSDGARTLIRGVRAQLNGGSGISAGDVMIQGSTAGSNGQHGFTVGRAVVLDSVAYDNKGVGFNGFGSNLALGRSVAQGNKAGNIVTSMSLGGNLDGFQPF